MRGVNKVVLVGHIGNDPKIKTMQGGLVVANISLATNHSTKNSNGEWEDAVEWHRVVLFDKLAKVASEYLKKGGLVYIEGRLQTNRWQDQNGVERFTTNIIAQELQMLGSTQKESNSSVSYDRPEESSQSLSKPLPQPSFQPSSQPITQTPQPQPQPVNGRGEWKNSTSAYKSPSTYSSSYDDDISF